MTPEELEQILYDNGSAGGLIEIDNLGDEIKRLWQLKSEINKKIIELSKWTYHKRWCERTKHGLDCSCGLQVILKELKEMTK